MSKKRILIIDGGHLSHRIHNVRYYQNCGDAGLGLGMIKTIRKLQRINGYDRVEIALDKGTPKHRKELSDEYKATRSKCKITPEQFDFAEKLLGYAGVKNYWHPDLEADDVIACRIKKLTEENSDIVVHIYTNDKDIYQLIHSNVYILRPKKLELHTPSECVEKFGVTPNLIPHYLALVGDKSDNIDGIKGIGSASARKYLSNKEKLSKRRYKKIKDNMDKFLHNLSLTVIKDDYDCVKIDYEKDWEKFKKLAKDNDLYEILSKDYLIGEMYRG